MRVDVTIDGVERSFETDGLRPLSDLLRVEFGVLSQVRDCPDGSCGACAVIVDDELSCPCMIPLVHVDGSRITTIQGLDAAGAKVHRAVERAFAARELIPCDVCFPATILFMAELLGRSRLRESIDEAEVRAALAGLGCGCGIHAAAVAALTAAANEVLDPERPR